METPGSAGPQKPQAHAEHQPQARPDVAGSAAQISFERLKQYPLFAKLPVIIDQLGAAPSYRLFVRRSSALWLAEWLIDAAQEFRIAQ